MRIYVKFGIFQSFFENDRSHLDNDYVKFVMCMLQDNENFKDLIVSVPSDVQALVLLHNGVSDSNYTSKFISLHIQKFVLIISFSHNLQLQRVIWHSFMT